MSELSEKTLHLIAARGIRPQSLWGARIRNTVYWTVTFFLIVLSAWAMAFIFHAIFEIDWRAYSRAHFSWLDILVSGVPFLSLFLLSTLLCASVSLWRRTRRGYRWSTFGILVLLIGSSGLAGYLIENSVLDEPVEAFLLRSFPHSELLENSLRPSAERQWTQPKKGLLGGIVKASDTRQIMLLDSADTLWVVDYSGADIATDVTLQPDKVVKIIGQQTDIRTFQANEIRNWKRPHERERTVQDHRTDDASRDEQRERGSDANRHDTDHNGLQDQEHRDSTPDEDEQ
jgi:hypothetical protein